MNSSRRSHGPTEWTPATSAPGENYTVEGRIAAAGAFFRGAKNRDPRLRAYRHGMWVMAAKLVGLGIAAMVAIAVALAIF